MCDRRVTLEEACEVYYQLQLWCEKNGYANVFKEMATLSDPIEDEDSPGDNYFIIDFSGYVEWAEPFVDSITEERKFKKVHLEPYPHNAPQSGEFVIIVRAWNASEETS